MRARRFFGTVLVAVGLALCAAAGFYYLSGHLAQREARRQFEQRLLQATPSPLPAIPVTPWVWENPGISSPALPTPTPAPAYPYGEPVARIRIPVARIDYIVFGGTDPATLKKGPGHVPGTALPGAEGPPNNCVITGHRDSHFRHLGWLRKGETIELDTPKGEKTYRIVEREIVKPDAVSVLAPTKQPRLTLITCYPFNYIGPAPERFVLIAEPVGTPPLRHRS